MSVQDLLRARKDKRASIHRNPVGAFAIVNVPPAPYGSVLVNGELWMAVSAKPDHIFSRGDRVTVAGIQGVHLAIKPANMQS